MKTMAQNKAMMNIRLKTFTLDKKMKGPDHKFSLSPEELGEIVGLDITKQDFWELGIKQYEAFVNEFEKAMN